MAKNKEKKSFQIAGLMVSVIARFCSFLPLRAAHAIGSGLGLLFYYLPNKTKRITLFNIQHCFTDHCSSEHQQLLKKTLKETGKTLTEMGAMWYWSNKKLLKHTHFEGEELLNNTIEPSKKAAIILCPHLGCWEIVNLAICSKTHLTSLYRPQRIKMLDRIMLAARQRSGGTLVPTSNSGVRSLYKALQSQQLVGLLPDQDPGEGKGIYAPFFGIPTNTMSLAGRLITQTKPQVLLVYGVRLTKGRGYKVIIKQAPEQILIADQDRIAMIINNLIETSVREIPEQYQWTYKRFKYQPDGSNFYADMDTSNQRGRS
ncbi:Lipid A biosynthesis lauroyl acyltransferase [hydrothermal vent metagenome]|uniref:Lipid A biosynthesis lauroyl acyltransferase n=1 Tax=hydrothermal vent metagenome TaxID=652676 RepID=A0A3B0ZGM6_9ZZZZ